MNLILTWSENCVISSATVKTKFATKDTKRYIFFQLYLHICVWTVKKASKVTGKVRYQGHYYQASCEIPSQHLWCLL